MWSLLAGKLAAVLPTSDEFDQSDAAMMTAVAFITEVLKYPFELLARSRSAGRKWNVSACTERELETQTKQVCEFPVLAQLFCAHLAHRKLDKTLTFSNGRMVFISL